jgi:hypothetical protein
MSRLPIRASVARRRAERFAQLLDEPDATSDRDLEVMVTLAARLTELAEAANPGQSAHGAGTGQGSWPDFRSLPDAR